MIKPNVVTAMIEAKYLSQSHTHLQVEVTQYIGGGADFSEVDEFWIPLEAIHSEFNIFDDVLDIDVDVEELDRLGIAHD